MAERQPRWEPDGAATDACSTASPPSPRRLESLWIRLMVGGRIRPRDAEMLRRLMLPPFERGVVYELNAQGYVIAVGMPGNVQPIDHAKLLAAFESSFGEPESFNNVITFQAR